MFLKNLNALNIQNPSLAKRLKDSSLEEAQKTVSVLQAQSGDLIIAYKDEPLDDSVNPLEKSKSIWDGLVKDKLKKNDIVLVFGLGLGYLFKRAYVSSDSKIVVYEPKIDILRFVLEYVDFSEQLKDKRVYFADEESDCVDYLSEKYITNDKIEMMYSDIYLNLFSDSLLSLSKKIIQMCESKKADVSTIKILSKTWAVNSIENVKHMENSRPLRFFKDILEGKTALIIGAGPSLKNNLELIKQNRDKFVIFAVNKVFDYVIDNGIEPDFLVAADAMWIDYTIKVRPDVFKGINLIATTKADSFIYNQNFHSIFNYYLKNDSFYEELNKKFPEEITFYESEGTAVSQCYYSALEMGFSKIIFCGLDLAIRQNEAYALDVEVTNNDDGSAVFSRQTKRLVEVKSVSGAMVQTRDDYAMFVNQLGAAFLKNNDAKLYNTTDFGAYIEGMAYEPLASVVSGLEAVNVEVNLKIDELFLATKDKWQEIFGVQVRILKKQQENIRKIKSRIEVWLNKNTALIESLDNNCLSKEVIDEVARVRTEEISIIKDVLNNSILGSYFQSEFLEYSQLNTEPFDFVGSRLYSLDLFRQIALESTLLIDKLEVQNPS